MQSTGTMEAAPAGGAAVDGGYLLEVENVRKEFPGVVALDNVQLRLKRGSVHALMGENGAGKSTLMKIVAGIYTPDSGSFKLRGEDIKLRGPLDALEHGIAMIHQELNLMAPMTVAENIWIRREPLTRLGFVDHGEMRRKTSDLFKRLNIDIDPEVQVGTLTVASRQMVEIAKAVSYESDVLIMDEPTSALTEREVDHLFTIIRALRAAGHRHHLHHPQDERAVRDRRRVLGVSRRQVHRHQGVDRGDARRHHPHDGGPRDHPDVPEGGGADRRRGAVGQGAHA
jgi:inositol transport system ATP-binding protein